MHIIIIPEGEICNQLIYLARNSVACYEKLYVYWYLAMLHLYDLYFVILIRDDFYNVCLLEVEMKWFLFYSERNFA